MTLSSSKHSGTFLALYEYTVTVTVIMLQTGMHNLLTQVFLRTLAYFLLFWHP